MNVETINGQAVTHVAVGGKSSSENIKSGHGYGAVETENGFLVRVDGGEAINASHTFMINNFRRIFEIE